MNQFPVSSDVSVLLCEAAEWHLIGLLFQYPNRTKPRPVVAEDSVKPRPVVAEKRQDGDWQHQLTAVAAEVGDPVLKEAAALAVHEASEGLYHTTFGPGGPAPAREVSHRDTVQPGRFIAELRAFYEAFAYEPKLGEPPDHVSMEAGFVGYLRLKEAYAKARGANDEATVCADAANAFVEEHLSVLAEPLAEGLESSGIRYLLLAAKALRCRTGPPPAKSLDPSAELAGSGCSATCPGDPEP